MTNPLEQARLQSDWRAAKSTVREALQAVEDAQQAQDNGEEVHEDEPVVTKTDLDLARSALKSAQIEEGRLRRAMFGGVLPTEESLQ